MRTSVTMPLAHGDHGNLAKPNSYRTRRSLVTARTWTAGALACAAVASAVLVGGCAKQRDPIDRVQPNYVDKDMLQGTWYYQRTVVDMPASDGFTFVGATDFGGMSRVNWDVQENFLYGRRYTELIKNADDRQTVEKNGGRYLGEPVAVFRITSHFDIARSYNDVTGEEMNVLTENSVDRPWYERKYMRVDWSENLVHNYSLDFEAQSVESVPYYVQEIDPVTKQANPDAPHFEPEDSYFDITTKLIAKAGTIYYPGYGDIPLCWLGDFKECGAGEYTIRHSFKRIDAERQYEPMPYKGKSTEVFGFFWTDRLVYDAKTGILEQNRERYLNRHNIWKRWSYGNTPIDPSAREVRPIVYHVNTDWPKNDTVMLSAARDVADKWNAIYRDVVKAAGKVLPANQRMFILCEHNPVQAGDPAECGAPGTTQRIGDLRYSFMAYVPKYMTYGLLGLGPSNTDPETGEIISGTAYVYHYNNTGAFKVQQMVQLLNGQIDATQYIDGVDLTDWVQKVTSQNQTNDNLYGLEDAKYMVGRIAGGPAAHYWDAERRAPSAADEAFQREHGTREWLRPVFDELSRRNTLSADTDGSRGKLARVAGTPVEEMLLNDEVYGGSGFDPRLPLPPVAKDRASVARGGLAKYAEAREFLVRELAEKRNMYLPEMADDALLGLAREMAGNGMSPDQIYDSVRKSIYTAVFAHEVGHTLGLMHNFGGSDDAVNYFDQYWDIRAADGTVEPRLQDPITDYEINNKLYNYAYSSVMDYAGRYTIDGAGPGKYDRAAMMYGYAGKIEVFKNRKGIPASEMRDWYESDGDIITFYNAGPKAVHYTSFYNRMGTDLYDGANRELVNANEFSEDFATDAQGRSRVPYIFCSHNRSDLGDNCLTRDFGADSSERMKNIIDELDTWYITRNFPRGSVGDSQWSYVERWYPRIYGRMKHWHDMYGLYAQFLPKYYTPEQLQTFFTDPATGWGTKTWAVQNAFNYLVRTVLTPDIAGYDEKLMPDGTSIMAKSDYTNAPVNLDVTNGRFYSTSWWDGSRECGYTWWECLHHVGYYLDKIMAIEALSDVETNFVGRSTPEDIREWKIGFYNTFGEQISKLNKAIMGQDWSAVGPYIENNKLRFPNFAGDLGEVHTAAVDPLATFSIQLYWQVLGQARFPGSFDTDFANESRIFVMGTGAAPNAYDRDLVTYYDPVSGKTYGAIAKNGILGGGAEVLRRANDLVARSGLCDSRRETAIDGDDCVEPANGFTRDGVTAMVADHNQLIDALVLVDTVLNYGDPYDP